MFYKVFVICLLDLYNVFIRCYQVCVRLLVIRCYSDFIRLFSVVIRCLEEYNRLLQGCYKFFNDMM